LTAEKRCLHKRDVINDGTKKLKINISFAIMLSTDLPLWPTKNWCNGIENAIAALK